MPGDFMCQQKVNPCTKSFRESTKMSGMPYLPIQFSRLGPVDLAFESDNNVIPFGLGPCSQAIEVFGRHGDQCWGSFESKWLHQKDASASCFWEKRMDNISAHYTTPRTNQVSQLSGLNPMQVARVDAESQNQPPCAEMYGGLTPSNCG